MKKLALILVVLSIMVLPGCGNLSPRQQQRINNQDGKIGEIENLANSMKIELGNLKTQNEIQNSRIGQMQQGMVNMQSSADNSGIQILSGSGGIVLSIIALLAATTIALHYRSVAKIQTKSSEILAQTIASYDDPNLENYAFQSAMYTVAEENILKLMKKQKSLIQSVTQKE